MDAEKYLLWETLVTRVATFVAKDFPETDKDDLFQELMLFVLTNDKMVSPKDDYMATGLTNKANQIAWSNRKAALYVSPQYAYRTSDVRVMLETVFEFEEWEHTFLPEDAASETHDDRLAQNSDLLWAYDNLGLNYQRVIYARYALGEKPKGEAAEKRLWRAVERMTDLLNMYRGKRELEGPGTRKVITNANARYKIAEQDG